jgi:hypothetical protein
MRFNVSDDVALELVYKTSELGAIGCGIVELSPKTFCSNLPALIIVGSVVVLGTRVVCGVVTVGVRVVGEGVIVGVDVVGIAVGCVVVVGSVVGALLEAGVCVLVGEYDVVGTCVDIVGVVVGLFVGVLLGAGVTVDAAGVAVIVVVGVVVVVGETVLVVVCSRVVVGASVLGTTTGGQSISNPLLGHVIYPE